jgi:hypothetical protein
MRTVGMDVHRYILFTDEAYFTPDEVSNSRDFHWAHDNTYGTVTYKFLFLKAYGVVLLVTSSLDHTSFPQRLIGDIPLSMDRPVFMRQWEKEKAVLYPVEVPPP